MVTANGRIIYMEDCAPISLSGDNNLPDNWHLTARDAFNGILLWKIPVKQRAENYCLISGEAT
jgi:hypothetical protein